MRKQTLEKLSSPSYVCIRQKNDAFTITAKAEVTFREAEDCAGIAMMQNDQNQLRLETLVKDKTIAARVIDHVQSESHTISEVALTGYPLDAEHTEKKDYSDNSVTLEYRLEVHGLYADLFCRHLHAEWIPIAETVPLRHLSTEESGGFVGCTAGMYASGCGTESAGYADFQTFSYRGGDLIK